MPSTIHNKHLVEVPAGLYGLFSNKSTIACPAELQLYRNEKLLVIDQFVNSHDAHAVSYHTETTQPVLARENSKRGKQHSDYVGCLSCCLSDLIRLSIFV